MPDLRPGNATVNVRGDETIGDAAGGRCRRRAVASGRRAGRRHRGASCAHGRDGGPREARYGPLRGAGALARCRWPALRDGGGQGRRRLRRPPRVARRGPGRAGNPAARRAAPLATRSACCAARRRSSSRIACARSHRRPRRSSCSRPTSSRSRTTHPQPRPTGARTTSPRPPRRRAPRSSAPRRRRGSACCRALPQRRVRASGRSARTALIGLTGAWAYDAGRRLALVADVPRCARPTGPGTVRRARRARARGDRAVSGLDLDDAASERLDELIGSCVSCGFCLPACPTFSLTGEESESPRGRIELVAALQAGDLDARRRAAPPRSLPRLPRVRAGLPVERAVRARSSSVARDGGAVSRTRTVDATLAAVRHPGARGRVPAGGPAARDVHPGAARRDGARDRSAAPDRVGATSCRERRARRCCEGASCSTRSHPRSRRLSTCSPRAATTSSPRPVRAVAAPCTCTTGSSRRVRACATTRSRRFPADTLVVSTSAGCGAALRERAPDRVVDLTEAVARAPELPRFTRRAWRLAIFDPCHLRHAQGVVEEPRRLAAAIATEVVELRDAGRCCGAAGVYALEQPELSGRLRADRAAAIGESGADAVVCGNPGLRAAAASGARRSRASDTSASRIRPSWRRIARRRQRLHALKVTFATLDATLDCIDPDPDRASPPDPGLLTARSRIAAASRNPPSGRSHHEPRRSRAVRRADTARLLPRLRRACSSTRSMVRSGETDVVLDRSCPDCDYHDSVVTQLAARGDLVSPRDADAGRAPPARRLPRRVELGQRARGRAAARGQLSSSRASAATRRPASAAPAMKLGELDVSAPP